MSAMTDLDNSLQFLTDGIAAHVAALAAARTKAADDTHLVDLKTKIDALANAVAASTAQV